MLFQQTNLALLFAAAATMLVLGFSAPLVLHTLRHWDLGSGSELQLRLERRSHLISSLMNVVLWTQVAALLLFIFNADRLAVMFSGAMCAVGTLNVNGWGFPALVVQILTFFLASTWLLLNRADRRARDYPLLRAKYVLVLVILPFAVAGFVAELNFFSNLKAEVITSCCGSLFSSDSSGLSAELAALPPRLAMAAMAAALAIAIGVGLTVARRRSEARAAAWGYGLAAASGLAFVASIIGIISFVSLYVYEHPHHHCPFCLLKADYDYQGYLLYLPLFAATVTGLGAGALQLFARKPGLAEVLPPLTRRLGAATALLFALLALAILLMIRNSRLILLGT